MEKGLKEKTGKPLAHWIKVVKDSKIEKHKAIIGFLKSNHNFTYGFANFVSHKARSSDAASQNEEDLIEKQYSGKENLKPIYTLLLKKISALGKDITVTPKNSSVSFIRKRQFALVKPATKTRIDLGLKIKDKPFTERLQNSGPFGTMCTHRVQIKTIDEVDSELMGWIQESYTRSV